MRSEFASSPAPFKSRPLLKDSLDIPRLKAAMWKPEALASVPIAKVATAKAYRERGIALLLNLRA
jgi:hypothetical protein